MALSPYTQDITPTVKAVEKSRQPSYAKQAVDLFLTYYDKKQNDIQDNLKTLQDDFTFEKQKINKDIKNYSDILALKDEIEQNYGGSTLNYALANRTQAYKNLVADHYGMRGQEGFKIYDEGDTPIREFVRPRAEKMALDLDNIFATAEKLNFSEDFSKDEIDKFFAQEINKLPTKYKKNIFDIAGDVFSGNGLNFGDNYDTLRQEVLTRVYSDIPAKELGTLGETYKNLYTVDKNLAKRFEDEVLKTGKIKAGVQLDTKSEIRTYQNPDGTSNEVNVIVTTYQNKDGTTGSFVTEAPVKENIPPTFTPTDEIDFVDSLSDNGKLLYEDLIKNKPFYDVWNIVKKDKANFKADDFDSAKKDFFKNQTKYYEIYVQELVSNGFGTVDPFSKVFTPSSDVAEKLGEGKRPISPTDPNRRYYSFDEWKIIQLDALKDAYGVSDKQNWQDNASTRYRQGERYETYAYSADAFTAPEWKAALDGENPSITNDEGEVISIGLEIENRLNLNNMLPELQADYKNKQFDLVTKDGLYFPEEPLILAKAEAEQLGIPIPVEWGWDINKDVLVFKPLKLVPEDYLTSTTSEEEDIPYEPDEEALKRLDQINEATPKRINRYLKQDAVDFITKVLGVPLTGRDKYNNEIIFSYLDEYEQYLKTGVVPEISE